VGDVPVHDAPEPLDRIAMRAIGRNETAGPREPFLHPLGVMVAGIVEKDMNERQQRIERFDRVQELDRRGGIDGSTSIIRVCPVSTLMTP